MIPNHEQFLAAIRQQKRVRLYFYSLPDGQTMDHECVPIGYGPPSGDTDRRVRYWFSDPLCFSGENPLGLISEQIVILEVLDRGFDPADYPPVERVALAEQIPYPAGY